MDRETLLARYLRTYHSHVDPTPAPGVARLTDIVKQVTGVQIRGHHNLAQTACQLSGVIALQATKATHFELVFRDYLHFQWRPIITVRERAFVSSLVEAWDGDMRRTVERVLSPCPVKFSGVRGSYFLPLASFAQVSNSGLIPALAGFTSREKLEAYLEFVPND